MKYPAKNYISLFDIQKEYPERYYSMIEWLKDDNKTIYRVFDAMGLLVHQATVVNDVKEIEMSNPSVKSNFPIHHTI